jgi:hypothetical protein
MDEADAQISAEGREESAFKLRAVVKDDGSYRNKDGATQMPLRNPSLALLK